jgi:stage III sporulation protein AF
MEYVYQWMKNLSFYLVLLSVLLQMIPGEQYKKYVKFFAGMILIMMLLKPILGLLGMT